MPVKCSWQESDEKEEDIYLFIHIHRVFFFGSSLEKEQETYFSLTYFVIDYLLCTNTVVGGHVASRL